jgi:hypothetical protein
MDREDLETESESVERAVDLLDRLFAAADGGRSVSLGQYEASTILALLTDKPYRVEVMSRLEDFAAVDTGD